MAEITPQMIKELRDKTGIGIGKCKEALAEANGDIGLAIANLRKAGMATAVKKEGRATNEGMIGIAENDQTIAIVEINAETDFVVKNDRFQEFLKNIADEVARAKPESLESFLSQQYSKEPTLTVDEYRATIVQSIGENIQIRRVKTFQKEGDHSIGVYSHHGGKIIAIVDISGSQDDEPLARSIAMHVAASHPEYLLPEDVPQNIVDHEKDIAKDQMKGKPENIIEKILVGKLNAYFDSVCLSRQNFIRDDSLKIADLVANRAKETGKPLTLASFTRWSVGK